MGATYTAVGACDGAGLCVQPTMGCGDYVCGADGTCLLTCMNDIDCRNGLVCTNGGCAMP
jgi:hypothetical protein